MGVYIPRQLDVFYISYDEPNRQPNWRRVREMIPHAREVHGIKGFEAAHKACADASGTDRFMTIDGDNWLLDGAFDVKLDDTGMDDVVFSFKSRNAVNGLEYGNGGLKCWRKDVLLSSSTHESSDSTDFCWELRYYQVDTLGSISVNNATPYQAWRAGYREGVKMSYIDGNPLEDFTAQWRSIYRGNLSRLMVWCAVGRDAPNGIWSMLGARQGLCDLIGGKINNTDINDYAWFAGRWPDVEKHDPDSNARYYGAKLSGDHDFSFPELDADASSWFKLIYMNPARHGLMR